MPKTFVFKGSAELTEILEDHGWALYELSQLARKGLGVKLDWQKLLQVGPVKRLKRGHSYNLLPVPSTTKTLREAYFNRGLPGLEIHDHFDEGWLARRIGLTPSFAVFDKIILKKYLICVDGSGGRVSDVAVIAARSSVGIFRDTFKEIPLEIYRQNLIEEWGRTLQWQTQHGEGWSVFCANGPG